jgi:hypothetical protein
MTSGALADTFGRVATDLRVSLTDRCNLRCSYCMPAEGLDWLPNDDAIRYFTREIMPLIKSKVPDVTLTVVGRNPAPALVDLSKEDKSLIITGRVDDVRPYMENAAAYIVPLRIGGGTRLKIFEAMAMEKAVVSTTVGAEGLPLQNGVELLLADEPASFADAVVRVLTDHACADELGQRAATVVRENFGWRQVTEQFMSICSSMRTVQSSSFSLLSPKHSLKAEL